MEDLLKIHFVSGLLQTVAGETTSMVYTSEIIIKGQILISKAPVTGTAERAEIDESGSQKKIELVPGQHTALSEDGNALIALCTGYPQIHQTRDGGLISVQVDMVPLLQISEDNMQVLLTLYPPPTDKPPLDHKQLETILINERINYGIDQAILKESINKLAILQSPISNIPIARGMLPIDGKDAYLRFELEIGPIPGKMLRDGTIDFRERKIFTGVDENQVIASRVPETAGTPGINIFGESIPQWPGKDITVKISGDVSYSQESGQVIASKSGVLSTVKGNDIKVSAKQIIPGNVDFSVGNIESKDCVEIKGSIHPGFSVKTRGDLLIGGNVEGAIIISKGNVVIKGGLLSATTRLETLGDADINFTERAEIIAGGGIIIRKGGYYSKVTGGGDICCSPESKVVGCVFCSTGNFVGGNVGSHQAGPATIAAGVDNKRYTKHERLRQQIVETETKLETLRCRKEAKSIVREMSRQYEVELRELQSSFRKLNLIPNTPEYSRNEPAFNHSDARIIIHGTAAIATTLRIGNLTKTLDDEYSAVEFFIDRDLGKITVKKL